MTDLCRAVCWESLRGLMERSASARGAGQRHRLVALVAAGVVCGAGASVYGQPQRLPRGGPRIVRPHGLSPSTSRRPAVLIEPSAPVSNLFARAAEGEARGDWKFTIDCLQRIIDDPEDSLMPRALEADADYVLYESARSEAMRRLALLPPEGLRAYRLLYDGKANRLYELAERSRDPRHLRSVVRRFLLTRYGDDAADLLASWALDEGRPDEAVTVLTDLRELVPDSDVSASRVAAKLVAAYALLGRRDEAEAAAAELRQLAGGKGSTAGTGSLGRWSNMTDELLGFRPLSMMGRQSSSFWAVVGGAATRRGLMAAVEPMLTDRVPWAFELPGRSPDAWRRAFFDDPEGPLSLPAAQLVTDGDRLFVPTRLGCLAVSINDLSLAWQSPAADLGRGEVGLAVQHAVEQAASGLERQVSGYEDHIVAAASIADGVVLVVSREGLGQYTQRSRDEVQEGALGAAPGPVVGRRAAVGTRLIALDAATGEVRWTRGRTLEPADPLDGVTFHSVPLAVGDELWVPYSRHGELSVAVLDPSDGALHESVSLCSLQGQADFSRLFLPPAAGSGLVFVPSAHGVLFCIDAYDRTVRWAGAYDTDWLFDPVELNTRTPSPPVVAGGLVLLAPVGNSELLAFSITSGRVMWSSTGEDGSYIIAADDQHIWLGGRSVECVSLSNGQLMWGKELSSAPTGRAVLSGQRLYVPTLDGLLSLTASDGEEAGYAAKPGYISEQGPLGNLLCVNDALFSISTSWIRMFPDVGRSYARTLSRHEADPTNSETSIRLGWLELLRGRPENALNVLDTIPKESLEGDGGRALEVAEARVEATLTLAERVGDSADAVIQKLELLERAREIARSAADRLRCGLQIADVLRSMGRRTESFCTLWELGVGPDAGGLFPVDEHVAALARVQIGSRLQEVRTELTEEEQRAVAEIVLSDAEGTAAALAGPDQSAAQQHLEAMLELDPFGPAARHARLALCEREVGLRRFEKAEQLLSRVARLGDRRVVAGSAFLRLCSLLREQGADASVLLAACLDSVEDRFGDEYITEEWQIPDSQKEGVTSRVVSDWVAEMRVDLVPEGYPRGDGRGDVSAVGGALGEAVLSGDVAWTVNLDSDEDSGVGVQLRQAEALGEALAVAGQAGPPRLVHFAEPTLPVMPDRVVFQAPGDVVYCQRAIDGELLWHTTLRLPDRLLVDTSDRFEDWVDMPRRAVADGQTAVFNGADGLFAVGLVTGRRIWARPYEDAVHAGNPARADWTMAARDGLLAAMPRSGRLALMQMLDGSTIWERDLRGERVRGIWMTEDRVLTSDPVLQRVHLFRRSNGELIRQVLFKQPSPDVRLVEMVRTGGVLCGPVSMSESDGLMAVDLASGETSWEVTLDKPLYALFKPKEGYLGVGLLGGDVRILDATTGELVLSHRVPGTHAVIDGVLLDGTFLVEYVALRNGSRLLELSALDVATGLELWRREDVFPLGSPSEPLPIVGGRVPVALRSEGNQPRRQVPVRVSMLDIRTGSNVGEELSLLPGQRPVTLNGDLLVLERAGVVVISTDRQIHALRIESSIASESEEEVGADGA